MFARRSALADAADAEDTAPAALAEDAEQILDRIELTVLRRLDGLVQGENRSHFRGAGVDFTDLRDYQPYDDVRHIDWNVTARTSTPFVRQYVEDRDLTAWFLLDRSASMTFGSAATKAAVLVDTVTALARLVTRSGNRVGAVLWNNGVDETIEPRPGRNQVLRITRRLLQSPGRGRGATELGLLGETAAATIRRRSLLFVVSDFVTEPGWEKPFALLSRHHDVVGIRILDPAETALPDAGVVVIQDSETGEQIHVDTGSPELRRRFAEAAAAREADLVATTRRVGIDLHTISTADDLVRSLAAMVDRRRRYRR